MPYPFAAAFLLAGTAFAAAQQTTIRNERGQTIGTVTIDSQGNRTFRDPSGRTTGTSTTDPQGTTTFRDERGRTTGSTSTPRR